jgi:hypothetical protein
MSIVQELKLAKLLDEQREKIDNTQLAATYLIVPENAIILSSSFVSL